MVICEFGPFENHVGKLCWIMPFYEIWLLKEPSKIKAFANPLAYENR